MNPNKPKQSVYKAPGKSKVCRKPKGCGKSRLIRFFGKHHMTEDRLNPYCKDCVSKYLKAGKAKDEKPSTQALTRKPKKARITRAQANGVVDSLINGDHKKKRRRELTKELLQECGVLKFEADPATGRVRYAIVETDYIDLEE